MNMLKNQTIAIPHGFEANYTIGFLKGLADNQVRLLAISCDDTEDRLNEAAIPNLNLRGSNDDGRSFLEKAKNLFVYYFKLIHLLVSSKPSVVHFTGIFRNECILFEGLLLNWIFRICSGNYVYTAHNTMPHSKENSSFFKLIYRVVYSVPNIILVNTDRAKEELVSQFKVSAAKIKTISIGLNEEMPITELSREQARLQLNLKRNDQAILFFGKIDSYKGLDILIEAFEASCAPSRKLVIAGTYRTNDYKEKIQEQIRLSAFRSQIIIREEMIPNEEVEIYFKACDVLCLPYRNIYQSGLVFLAPRFGIPIIASDVGSMREYVPVEAGLLCEKENAESLASAIRDFFGRPRRFDRDALIKRGEQFSWKSICRRIKCLYQGSV